MIQTQPMPQTNIGNVSDIMQPKIVWQNKTEDEKTEDEKTEDEKTEDEKKIEEALDNLKSKKDPILEVKEENKEKKEENKEKDSEEGSGEKKNVTIKL